MKYCAIITIKNNWKSNLQLFVKYIIFLLLIDYYSPRWNYDSLKWIVALIRPRANSCITQKNIEIPLIVPKVCAYKQTNRQNKIKRMPYSWICKTQLAINPKFGGDWGMCLNRQMVFLNTRFPKYRVNYNQLHAVPCTQHGRQRKLSVKTFHFPLSAEIQGKAEKM